MSSPRLKIIPLGGLSEIGKNMMVMEYEDDIIIIDAGLMFPEEEMLGIDLVIPDIGYLAERREKIRGIVITHGHEDHIGALPYLLPQLNAPIYCTKLTQGLIRVKLKEGRMHNTVHLKVIPHGGEVTLGVFRVELFPVCHSIPDAAGLIISTPMGTIIHSGDFKLDYTPVDGNADGINDGFFATALPLSAGITGSRTFYVDDGGVVCGAPQGTAVAGAHAGGACPPAPYVPLQ